MIISKTPYRISFFGGGTDYPEWYKNNGGEVLSTTIDKYLYLTCRHLPPFFNHKHRIVWSQIEKVNSLDEIKHYAVKKIFKYMKIKKGLELHYDGDLPAQSGMGSSSAFVVGLLNILYAFKGIELSKKALADQSLFIEQRVLNETVGSQDQISTSYGGFNSIKFFKNKTFSVNSFSIKKKTLSKLENKLFIVFSGINRRANNIASKYVYKLNKQKKLQMLEIQTFVKKAKIYLNNDMLDDFGYLIGESWQKKKELSNNISSKKIDYIYSLAMKNGALGGKVLGAGGGGMMVFYVNDTNHEKFKKALSSYLIIPFKFETSGSNIIINSNKTDIYK